MNAYYDTGVLLPLYVQEVFSEPVTALAESRREPIPFNLLQQLEMDTALRLKAFRGEIAGRQAQAVIADRDEDVHAGRLVLRPVDWIAAIEDARRIGAQTTARWGCRTLDLVHVAVAVQWTCAVFVTADDRQLKAACSAGLQTLDVRALGRKGGADAAAAATVREKRARYGSRSR
jgi:hypothetical protein